MKNIEDIKQELAELKRSGSEEQITTEHFQYFVGNFHVVIYTHRIQEHPAFDPNDRITKHEILDVYVNEQLSRDEGDYFLLQLEVDPRFKDHAPIKYSFPGYSTGVEMPLVQLCELIKYLYRLSDLAAFK